MAEETEQIKALISEEMANWAVEFKIQRIAALRSKRIDAGGTLSKSIAFEILNQATSEATELLIAFETYGRYIDMKNLKYSGDKWGREFLTRLEGWVSRKGLDTDTKFINNFLKNRKLKKAPATLSNQIAWGIVKKRLQGRYKRRYWYNKSKTAAIVDLYNTVAAALPNKVGESIKESFKS